VINVLSSNELNIIDNEIRNNEKSFFLNVDDIGKQIALAIDQAYSHKAEEGLFCIIGKGMKSFYALKSMQYLSEMNWAVSIYFLEKTIQFDQFLNNSYNKIQVFYWEDDDNYMQFKQCLLRHPIWFEAYTEQYEDFENSSYKTTLEELAKLKIENALPHYLISIRTPSWLHTQNKELFNLPIKTDLTFLVGAVSIDLLDSKIIQKVGELRFVTSEQYTSCFNDKKSIRKLVDSQYISKLLSSASFDLSSAKNAFIIDGSIASPISPALTAMAFLCLGSPSIKVAIPSPIYNINASQIIDAEWLLLPNELGAINEDAIDLIDESLQPNTILLLGPGLEVNETSEKFFIRCISKDYIKTTTIGLIPPTKIQKKEEKIHPYSVLLLSKVLRVFQENNLPDWYAKLPAESIIFIYPDDLTVLEDSTIRENTNDAYKVNIIEELCKQWQITIIYLSNPMIIASPNKQSIFVPVRSDRFSFSPNTTSVFMGLTASLLQRNLTAYDAAVAGGWIFSAAIGKIHTFKGSNIFIQPQEIVNYLSTVLSEV